MRKRSRLNRKIKYYDIFDESAPKTNEINESFSKLKKCTETRTKQSRPPSSWSAEKREKKKRTKWKKQDTHTIIRKWSTRDKYYLVICLLRFFLSHECMFVVDTKEFNKSRKMYGREMKRKEKKGDNGQRWWAWKWWDSQESFDSGYHNCLPLNWFNWKFVQMKCTRNWILDVVAAAVVEDDYGDGPFSVRWLFFLLPQPNLRIDSIVFSLPRRLFLVLFFSFVVAVLLLLNACI